MTERYIGGNFCIGDSPVASTMSQVISILPESINGMQISGFESGVDALSWLVRELQQKKGYSVIYFPLHYCQESIDRFRLKCETIEVYRYKSASELPKQKILVVWNHFNGYTKVPEQITDSADYYLIEDCVQSLHSLLRCVGSACFTSLRKWGEMDLALLYAEFTAPQTDSHSDYRLAMEQARKVKKKYQETGQAQLEDSYLHLFKEAEKALNNTGIAYRKADDRLHFNWQEILRKREENASILCKRLADISLSMKPESELFVIIHTERRDELKRALQERGIFAPIHWPDSLALSEAQTSLSLPIDQRYGEADMNRLAKEIEEALGSTVL